MEKIFLIFPKTHVNLSPELGVCTILNSFIYNYFSSISSNFFESKILITSAGLKKNQSNSDFLLAVGKMNRFCIPTARTGRLILSQKCKNGNVSAPVGAISLEIACAARSVGVGQVRRLRRLAMTLFRLLSLSLSRFLLFGLLVRSKSWPRVSQQRFLRGARRVALIRLPFLAPMLRAISYTVLSSNLYLSTRQSGGS